MVAVTISKKIITTLTVVNILRKVINNRYNKTSDFKLIIHTDIDTQLSSKSYNNFVKKFNKKSIPSMARENTPTDNSLVELDMRTFQEHKVDRITIEEELLSTMTLNAKFNSYRSYFNLYIKSLNGIPNKKSFIRPERDDKGSTIASMLMVEPFHSKAQFEYISEDLRLPCIKKYKLDKQKVVSFLQDPAVQKAELVDRTLFDFFYNQLAYVSIDKKLAEI